MKINSVGFKITLNNLINIVFIIMICSIAFIFLNYVRSRESVLKSYFRQNNVTERLQNILVENKADIQSIIYNNETQNINELFTRNEVILSVFDEYRDTAYENNLVEDLSFAIENEKLIVDIRTNTVKCINHYKNNEEMEAVNYYLIYVLPFIKKFQFFTDDMIYQRNKYINKIDDEIEESIQNGFLIVIFLIGFILILNIILGSRLKKSIVKPIKDITKISNHVAKEKDLTQAANIKSNDEIGQLGSHFNILLDSLKSVISTIKESSETSKEISRELTSISHRTSGNSEKILSSFEDIQSSIKKLNNEILGAVSAIEQITLSISNIAGAIENQSSALNESSSSINQIVSQINNISTMVKEKTALSNSLLDTARNGMDKMEQSVQSVNKIAGSTENMLEMIGLINEVASQTDILSMNAAIEAAHAGETGKGFAVVAGEMRKLSNNVKEYSKQIDNLLKKTATDIQNANKLNNISGNAFNDLVTGIKNIANAMTETSAGIIEIETGSQEILSALKILLDVTENIKEDINEINTNSQSINKNIIQISENMKISSKNIDEVLINTKEITVETKGLTNIVNSNEENVQLLNKFVNEFKMQ